MTFLPAGWSREEVLHELIEVPRRSFISFPELEIIDRPEWMQLTCQLFPSGGFNEVSRAKLSPHEADARIDATLDHYRRRGLMFRWSVLPDSTPDDLPARLAARGLQSIEVAGMSASTALWLEPSALHAEETRDADLFARVMSEGWGAPLPAFTRTTRLAVEDPARRQRLFLVRDGADVVGAASALFFERSVHLLGGVVLPEARLRGAYRALLIERLRVAREAGLQLATVRAIASTSAPVLARRGFDEWFRYPSFSPPAPASSPARG